MRTSQLDQTLPVQILANEGPKTLECSRVDRCARTTKQQLDLCRHVWHLCVRSFVEAEMSLNLLGKVVGPVLSLAGGLIGIIVGVGISLVVPSMLGWPTLVSPVAILGSVVFSAAVGIFFGYYPARKAAALDPIDALRYE